MPRDSRELAFAAAITVAALLCVWILLVMPESWLR